MVIHEGEWFVAAAPMGRQSPDDMAPSSVALSQCRRVYPCEHQGRASPKTAEAPRAFASGTTATMRLLKWPPMRAIRAQARKTPVSARGQASQALIASGPAACLSAAASVHLCLLDLTHRHTRQIARLAPHLSCDVVPRDCAILACAIDGLQARTDHRDPRRPQRRGWQPRRGGPKAQRASLSASPSRATAARTPRAPASPTPSSSRDLA